MATKKRAKKKTARRAKKREPMPAITPAVVRGACTAGAQKWKSAKKAAAECKEKSGDASAFGSVGGKYSAAARGGVAMGRMVK